MKVKLATVKYFYTKKDEEKLEKLGFSFVPSTFGKVPDPYEVMHASDSPIDFEVRDLDSLMILIEVYGPVIMSVEDDGSYLIKIYDGYVE